MRQDKIILLLIISILIAYASTAYAVNSDNVIKENFSKSTFGKTKKTEDNSNVSIGLEYNHLWKGVIVADGVLIAPNIHAEIWNGFGFGIDSYFNTSTLEMSWAEYRLNYNIWLAKIIKLQAGAVYYDRDGDSVKYPDTSEAYIRTDVFFQVGETRVVDLNGTVYYDFRVGQGMYIEFYAKYYFNMTESFSAGPGAIFGINLSNLLIDTYNSTGIVTRHDLELFIFSEITLSKKSYIYLQLGAAFPTVGTDVSYTTTVAPYANVEYKYKF